MPIQTLCVLVFLLSCPFGTPHLLGQDPLGGIPGDNADEETEDAELDEFETKAPAVIGYLSFDRGLSLLGAKGLRGPAARSYVYSPPPVALTDGIRGKAARLGSISLPYGARHLISRERGAIGLWVRFDREALRADTALYERQSAARDGRFIRWWNSAPYLLVDASPLFQVDARKLPSLKPFADTDWHHVVVCWEAKKNRFQPYVDGKRCSFRTTHEVYRNRLFIDVIDRKLSPERSRSYRTPQTFSLGVFGTPDVRPTRPLASFDEITLWDRPLDQGRVSALFQKGRTGKAPSSAEALLSAVKPARPFSFKDLGAQRPDRPSAEEWRLRRETAEDSQARRRYSLDGLWRCQLFGAPGAPPTAEGLLGKRKNWEPWEAGPQRWLAVRLPVVPKWNTSSRRLEIVAPQPLAYQGGDWVPIDRAGGLRLKLSTCAWLERDLEIPADWGGRRLFWWIGDVRYFADVSVNGQSLGQVAPRQGLRFELTRHVKYGQVNRLSLLSGGDTPIQGAKIPPLRWGVNGPMYLEVWDATGCTASEPLLAPDVEAMKLGIRAVFENPAEEARSVQVSVRLANGTTGESLPGPTTPATLTLPANSRAERLVWLPFPDARLWWPEDPFLYRAWVRVQDGQSLDESFRVRFGFREVRHKGRHILLNGRPIIFKGTSHNTTLLQRPEDHRATIEGAFDTNLNCTRVFTPTYSQFLDRCLDLGDEMGFMYHVHVGSPPAGESRFPAHAELFRQVVRRLGNHPSIVMWRTGDMPVRVHDGNFCPALLAGPRHDPPQEWAVSLEQSHRYLKTWKETDPQGRPWYTWHSGYGTDMRAMYNFFGYDVPLQTREEWPAWWAKHGATALMDEQVAYPCDVFYGWCYHRGWSLEKLGSYANLSRLDPLWLEWAASYFGDEIYTQTPRALAESYAHPPELRAQSWPGGAFKRDPQLIRHFYWDLKELFVKWTNRSWRTYGVSVLLHSAYVMHNVSDEGRQPYGDSLRQHHAPLYAYIGGPPGAFVRKDHAFFAGETVVKQAIVLNDSHLDLPGKLRWSLHPKGVPGEAENSRLREAIWSAEQPVIVRGGTNRFPVTLEAPAEGGAVRRCVLRLRFEPEEGTRLPRDQSLEDRMRVEFFARAEPVPVRRPVRIAVHDVEDRWGGILSQALVGGQVVVEDLAKLRTLEGTDLVLVGRKAYDDSFRSKAKELDLAPRLRNGLRLLCFEQTGRLTEALTKASWGRGRKAFPGAPGPAGLRVFDRKLRQLFIRATDHPVLEGLADEDFANWRGQTDFVEPYPVPETRPEGPVPLNEPMQVRLLDQSSYYHWSNNGTVALFQFEKPQAGGFRVLLEGGFDRMYAGLVEQRLGQGMAWYCQCDVTSRYGSDPVATLLVYRLLQAALRPASDKRPRDIAGQFRSPALHRAARAEEGSAVLCLDASKLDEPGGKQIDEALANGRTIFLVGQPPRDLVGVVGLHFGERDVWRAGDVGEGITAGLGPADFHWRQVTRLRVATATPPAGRLYADGRIADLRVGPGRLVFCAVEPNSIQPLLATSWLRGHQGAAGRKADGGERTSASELDDLADDQEDDAENLPSPEMSNPAARPAASEPNADDSLVLRYEMPKAKASRIVQTLLFNLNAAFESSDPAEDDVPRQSLYPYEVQDFNPYYYQSW